MTTRKLLWGMMWRGTVWGAMCGGVFGIAFALLVVGVIYLPDVMIGFQYSDWEYLSYVLTDAAFFGLPALPVGFILGAPVGSIAGAVLGCIITIFTRIFFHQTEVATHYRIAVRVVSGASAIIATFVMLGMVIINYQEQSVLNDVLSATVISLIVAPTLIFVQKPTTGWYVDEMLKTKEFRKKQELQSRLFS